MADLDGISIKQTGSYSFFSRSQYVEIEVSQAYSSRIYHHVQSVVERNRDLIREIVVDAYENNLTNHPLRVAFAEELIAFVINECPKDEFDMVTLKVNHKKNTLGDSLEFVTYVETEQHLDLNLNTW
ncbi:MAG: hypothetical protein MJ097_05190 [Dorea sp.]|nr:hypothetical protein [Dorea sp.]